MDKIIDIHKTSSIDQCHVIELGKNHHDNGNLTVIENYIQLPYKICRTYYLYDIPGGEERGGHSHKKCYEFLVAISGSFDVTVDDGKRKCTYNLNRPYKGLLITPGIWRTLNNFSSGSVCLVLASEHFDENDYIREYADFAKLTASKQK